MRKTGIEDIWLVSLVIYSTLQQMFGTCAFLVKLTLIPLSKGATVHVFTKFPQLRL